MTTTTTTTTTEYVLVVSEEVDAEAFAVALRKTGLTVVSRRKQRLVVRAPKHVLDDEAEHLGVLKRRASDGKSEEFSKDGEYLMPWSPAEEAMLTWAHLEHVGGGASILEGLREGPNKIVAKEAALTSLVTALSISGALEEAAPLHDPAELSKLEWWKASVSELEKYFGPEVAVYFAWMEQFTAWLVVPAVAGIACYARRCVLGISIDDDPAMPLYSLLVVFWAVFFVAFWRRRESELANAWGCPEDDDDDYEIRPEYRGEIRISPVTGRRERHAPPWRRYAAYVLSAIATAAMLAVAAIWHVTSLNLQGYVRDDTWTERYVYVSQVARFAAPGATFDPDQSRYLGLVALVPTVVHVAVVQLLNAIYCEIATKLTNIENHKHLADHQNAIALKRFFFEAFDAYAALFYLAFVQFDIVKLRSELVSIYMVDSARRVFMESILPLLITKATPQKLPKKDDDDLDDDLKPEYEPFDDYLEMVIEWGYLTLFAAAFPLGPALSAACNLVEMWNDKFKLINVLRRPRVDRDASIGIWNHVIKAMVWLAILTNVALFAFTSDQVAAWFPWLFREAQGSTPGDDFVYKSGHARYVVLLAALIEHVIALLAALLFAAIPAQTNAVRDDIHRRHYEQKTAAMRLRHANRPHHS
ncbi:hypothetical protein CTAYLR_009258 [Chrysophaeum taylorii]|uniref:Anoctamin transmembrane domain-containing protein n=1 Tax=Chrysophaeum taylorii TaxID=2483200 RepID=A0AAD7U650_9STRA|nr:hypothetical protein CTAYLR_009258 [Chrysophaeum taylorii]